MLHHHGHDKEAGQDDQHASLAERLVHHQLSGPVSPAEREQLLSQGEVAQGMIWATTPVDGDPGRSHLRVQTKFKDGPQFEFFEDLANLYQPAPDSPDAIRIKELRQRLEVKHVDRIPKLQLETAAGARVPLRYNPADRNRVVIDEPVLQKKAVEEYIARESRPKPQATLPAPVTGPPWVVPSHCPNCGAPVDQATASKADDPECKFCQQPLPVTPLVRS